jgi:hypothetical protein
MLVYYRLSDKNRRGKAPSYFTNENCLNNFFKNFHIKDTDKIFIIADNVSDSTIQWLKSYNVEIIRTNLGNSGSFDFSLKHAMLNSHNSDIVYFVENDYLHRNNSREAMDEAFNILNADYVSLYDSPEKYEYHYNLNYNNYVDFGQNIFNNFKSKIYYGFKNYWRTSNSFTMTFAMKKDLIRHDYEIFKYELIDIDQDNYSYKKIPRDFELFNILSTIKNRKLLTPMPGYSTHGDLLSPNIDWLKVFNGDL